MSISELIGLMIDLVVGIAAFATFVYCSYWMPSEHKLLYWWLVAWSWLIWNDLRRQIRRQ